MLRMAGDPFPSLEVFWPLLFFPVESLFQAPRLVLFVDGLFHQGEPLSVLRSTNGIFHYNLERGVHPLLRESFRVDEPTHNSLDFLDV